MAKVKLQSSDGDIFDVDVNVIQCSKLIRNMLEDLEIKEGDELVIPLPKINSITLNKVTQWATQHKVNAPPLEDGEMTENWARVADSVITDWDAAFLKVGQSTPADLMLAAVYLDIDGLLRLTCKYFASIITPELEERLWIVNEEWIRQMQE